MMSDNLTLGEIEQYWLQESNESPIPTREQKAATIAWTFGEYSGPFKNPLDNTVFRKIRFKNKQIEIILCRTDLGSKQERQTYIFYRGKFLPLIFEKKVFSSELSSEKKTEYVSPNQKLWHRVDVLYERALTKIKVEEAFRSGSLDSLCYDLAELARNNFGTVLTQSLNPFHVVDDSFYLR